MRSPCSHDWPTDSEQITQNNLSVAFKVSEKECSADKWNECDNHIHLRELIHNLRAWFSNTRS